MPRFRMTAKQKRRAELLKWRASQYESVTPKQLAESLSCESLLTDYGVPWRLTKAVTEFRHLRTDARVAACRAFLA